MVVKSRMDRSLHSPKWIALFPNSVTHNLSDNGSDHRAILLLDSLDHKGPKRYISFDQRWLSNLGATKTISDTWGNSGSYSGCKMFVLYSKLKSTRHRLVDWQWCGTTNSACNIQNLKSSLTVAKAAPNPNWDCVRELKGEIERKLRLEDAFWKRKARNQWILQGDSNTKYYHRIANYNKAKNYIAKLRDFNGIPKHSKEDKQQIAIDYFHFYSLQITLLASFRLTFVRFS
ncbi:hypothetical protein LINGRAPRIM_LOCUS2488 [Linum grandiflorum]